MRVAATALVDDTIPLLDLGPFLAGEAGADRRLAAELRWASETVGFYFLTNHGVAQALVDATFRETARFHALPMARKLAVHINRHEIGYLPIGGADGRNSAFDDDTPTDVHEALFIRRERTPDDPDVVSGKPWRGLNQWPAGLPGFRETILAYWRRIERFGQSLLPLYELALELPAGFFRRRFEGAHSALRLSHYPPGQQAEDSRYGVAPHTDSGFMTLVPQSVVPGLEIRTVTGKWIAVRPMPGSFLVNAGDLLHQWTNGRFLSTPHRAVNRSCADRYAIPFFYDPNTETMIECLPSCQGFGNAPRFMPRVFGDYCAWFARMNDRHQQAA